MNEGAQTPPRPMNRVERRRAMREAGLPRDTRRAIAYYRRELRAGRSHCITEDLAPWVMAPNALSWMGLGP